MGKDIIPIWNRRKASDVKRKDVINLLDNIVERGAEIQANRTLAVIRRMFGFAIERDILEFSPCNAVKAPAKENIKDRVLSDEEIKAQILDNYESDLETIITEKAAKIEAEKQRILEEIRLEVEPLEALLLESSASPEDIEITETQLDAQSKLDEINDQSSGRLS